MPHKVSNTVTADRDAFSGQVLHRSTAAGSGILEVQGIDPGHDPQSGFTNRYGLVVKGRSWQSKELALAADRELRVVMIDQLE